jgi:hypothetical protein
MDTNQIAPCQYFTNSAIFNTQGITNGDINDKTQTRTFQSYQWNFCEELYEPEKDKNPSCTANTSAYAWFISPNTCEPYGISEEGKTDTAGKEIKNSDNVITGLTLVFASPDDCATDATRKK